ncbi:MAG: hypothetical protein LAT82_00625 [Nanoarchaeota archaeon]|nr:hypothetical protein [Nanoarchaeota archaeon]
MVNDLTNILIEVGLARNQVHNHRFSQIRTENPSNLKKYILEESQRLNFDLPTNPYVLYYTLGDADFDEAQLWYPFLETNSYPQNNVRRNLEHNLLLHEIRDVSRTLSSRGDGYEVLEVFKHSDEEIKPRERIFALPRFRVYEYGEVVRESDLVGEREYADNFREEDREKRLEMSRQRAKQTRRDCGGRYRRMAKMITEKRR